MRPAALFEPPAELRKDLFVRQVADDEVAHILVMIEERRDRPGKVARRCRLPLFEDAVSELRRRGRQQGGLAAKDAEHRLHGDPGGSCHVLKANLGGPAPPQPINCRIEDSLASRIARVGPDSHQIGPRRFHVSEA